jgi:predicted transcriptional regulator
MSYLCKKIVTMKKHSGMRPHDIVILLKIAAFKEKQWLMKDLAIDLFISASEVSESLNRSMLAGLLTSDKKKLMTRALLEFLQYGIKYVYPQHPGPIVRGIPTAYSTDPLRQLINSEEPIVWPYAEGKVRGQSIEPLHPSVPKACLRDARLYELLALVDALRIGRVREQKLALEALKKRIC